MATPTGSARKPLPMLLVQRDGVPDEWISALRQSPRVQLFHAKELTSSPTAFSAHAARATIVVTASDPVDELVLLRTSGFAGPLVLAIASRYASLRQALLDADVLECLTLPIEERDLERVLDVVEALPQAPISYAPLGLLLDAVDGTARVGDLVVRLSQREFTLLHCLIRNGSRPVPVKEILDYVWGNPGGGTREIVDVNISQLRKKLRRIGLKDAIRTYRGFGYGLRAS